ncbi:Ig-like domain-containing protein [Leisingera sp. MMG026]|uniref:Ig-like domain-containing protein n=1 Tax=Leisingera sp. MMG026 TaxID=2909982 RepID=UPI0031CC487B|nr:Ig-like domain-containing protein [Leisingera sp. MMG026]
MLDGSAQIKAGSGDNEITTAGLNDVIQAGDGNNRIHAGAGNNRVKLGDGSNTVETGTGKDNLRAGDGDNMIVAGGGDNAVKAGHGNNAVQTGAGRDAIQLGDGNNTITSLGGNNKIKVGHGQNAIETGDGADSIKTGNGGNDISSGGGNDRIQTGNGDDRISSGAGDDYVNAGRGYDTVVLSGSFQDYDLDLSRYNGGRGKAYITSRAGSEGGQGTDTLLGVEALLFEEDGLLLDLNAPVGLQLQDDQITAEGEDPLAISLETLLENDAETLAGTSRVRVDDVSAGGLRVGFDGGIVTYNADDLLQGLKEGDVFEDSFTYYVTDAFGNRSQATVNVTLTGENDVPVADDDDLNGGLRPFSGYTPSPEWTVQGAGAILPWGTTVAGMKDGGYVVVWRAHKAMGTDERSDIWAKIYDADGSVIAETFLVNSFTEGYQVDPEVTVLSDGNIVIGWGSNYDTDDAKNEFPVRIFDKEGNAVSQELVVNEASDETVKDAEITALKGGGFVAVWTTSAQETDFRIALFDNNGRKIGDEVVYNLPDIGAPIVPSVIALESGGYAVAWSQPDYEPYYRSGGSKTIKVQLFDETGNTAAAEFDVTKPAGQLDSFPDVTEGPDGQLLVVWKFYDPDVSGSTAYFAKTIDHEGKVLVDEFQVHQDAAGGSGDSPPKVAWLEDSNFVIVWGAPGDSDPAEAAWARHPGVWARVFSSEGEPQGDEFVVNQQTMDTQSYYEIEALEGGRFIITWGDNYNGDPVKYTVFEGDGSPVELPYGFEDEVAEIAVLDLLANDSDPDADALTFALAASTSEYGALVSYDAETDTLFYDPTAAGGIQSLSDGEVLEDSFTYTISDGQGGTSEATVTILVGGLDEADAGAAPLFAQEDYGVLL